MKRSAGALVTLLLVVGLSATARSESTSGTAEQDDRFGGSLATGDFDGDGRDDLAVGVRADGVGGFDEGGAVNVVYGSGSGLSKNGNQLWYQGTEGVLGTAEDFDHFGEALAVGDFDGDGFDDLAVGVPDEDVTTDEPQESAGAVNVLYGSGEGLTDVGDQVLFQNEIQPGDNFGRALAAGDFNGDERDDLAVGAPGEGTEIPTTGDSGVVDVFNGSAAGLSVSSTQFDQSSSGIADDPENSDSFGGRLAAGNLGTGSQDDLVIAVVGENVTGGSNEGALHVIYGSGSGLGSLSQLWHQDVPGIPNTPEAGDLFAASLAIGNFGRGGPADLAIGVPQEQLEIDAASVPIAGVVHVLYGSSELGLTTDGDQLWHQSKPGVSDRIEPNDTFGSALTAADFGNSKRADLAISAANENLDGDPTNVTDAGIVHILFGSDVGLTSSQDERWHQDVEGVRDFAEPSDGFGRALGSGNFGSGARADLAVGVPVESLDDIEAGAANVLYGTAGGLSAAGDQFWHQTVP